MKKLISIVGLCFILLCGGVLAGCGDTSGSLSISFSSETIEMITTAEKTDYIITVNNAPNAEINFDFGFEESIAKVVENSVESLGDGKYSISIAPISAGKTNLKITLRGTAKNIQIPVSISEELQSFTLEQDVFVVRGGAPLIINSTYFKFTPEDTTQNKLTFELAPDQDLTDVIWENNTLTVGQLSTTNQINFIAKSEDVQNLSCNFVVKVVSEIDMSSLKITAYGQSSLNGEEFDFNKKLDLYSMGEHKNVIELVSNDPYLFQKLIDVDFTFFNVNAATSYQIDVFASDGIAGDLNETAPIKNKFDDFSFAIQSVKITPQNEPHTLTFRIYQANYPLNYKDVLIDVYVASDPREIRIDGQIKLPTIELFHNSEKISNYRFSVYPEIETSYNSDSYHYAISLYSSIDGSSVIKNDLSMKMVENYLDIKYNGVSFSDFETPDGTNALKTLKDLSGNLSLKPKAEYSGYFVINVACLDEDNIILCENNMFIKIYKGTSRFTLSDKYRKTGTIYVAMPTGISDSKQIFDGFTYDDGSTIGDLMVSSKTIGNLACEVEQDKTVINGARLIITPIKVGESEFIIQTQNGLPPVVLKIVVVREIDQVDFAIKIADDNQNSISDFKYKEDETYLHDTIDRIIIRGKGGKVTLEEQIANYSDANENSFSYSLKLLGTSANKYFEINGNRITALDFTHANGIDNPVQVQVDLIIYEVFGFELVEKNYDMPIYFDFTISAVDYIKNMNIRAKVVNNSEKTKAVSVYDKNVLSYINQDQAEAYIYLDLEKSQSEQTYSSDITISNWRISAGNIDLKTNRVGSVGYFYSTQYINGKPANGEDYIGKFVCDISGINTMSSFTITLVVTDDTGINYESQVTINIDEYIDVDSIYLTTPNDTIYVDNTETNRSVTLNVYVTPTNAMCQDIQVVVESSTANCLSYVQNGNTITFSYVSGGSGMVRIFPVSKMKTNSTTDEYGNYYYHIALEFRCADGKTPETALKISTLQALKNIKSNNHYYLDTIIDGGGKELYIPSFSGGSIRGTFSAKPNKDLLIDTGDENTNAKNLKEYNRAKELFENSAQLGGITNFIVKNLGINCGLFGEIGTNANIYNLNISTQFDSATDGWLIEDEINVGLLAGINRGTIEDVQISLSGQSIPKFTNVSTKNIKIYVGIVVGVNYGTISITDCAKISTLMTYMATTQQFEFINNDIDKTTYTISSYVGGIAGLNTNTGSIFSSNSSGMVLGMFGIHAHVNIMAAATYLGGVVGDNLGTVSGLKITGKLYDGSASSCVGGIIGLYSNAGAIVQSNLSRVFVRGYGSVSGLIGAVGDNIDTSKIVKNVIQATDDGNVTGVDASLIVRYGNFNFTTKIKDQPNLSGPITTEAIYVLCPIPLSAIGENENKAETYFTRFKETTFLATLEKGNYYGDIVCVSAEGDNASVKGGIFASGEDEVISPEVQSLVLAAFKQAKNSQDQTYINTYIKTLDLLKIVGISAKEVSISVDKISLASLLNFGEMVSVNGTGRLTIKVASLLNYSNVCELDIYLTNHYDELRAYNDKDYIESVRIVDVINKNTKKIYMNAYANIYNYKNTPVVLNNNNEITYECYEEKGIVDITVSSQELSIVSINDRKDFSTIKVYPIYRIDNNIYYAMYNNNIGGYVFFDAKNIKEKDRAVSQIGVSVLTGIENIVIGKTTIDAEPSDSISFTIEYNSYNENDYLRSELVIDGQRFALGDNGYFELDKQKLFKLQISNQRIVSENKYAVDCTFQMEQSKDVYWKYRNSDIMLYFYSNETNLCNMVQISYSPETITSVLVNNYSSEENEGMISDKKYDLEYFESKVMNSSKFSSTGDYNILQVFVYTKLAEFDYIEICLHAGQNGGYLALGKNGKIDINSAYTSIDGLVTLRVYKEDIFDKNIIFDETQHVLPITIIYSLPAQIAEGTRVPISLTFFKVTGEEASVCYQTETIVIAKSEKKVEFTIYNKESEIIDSQGIDQIYSVVRGKRYSLEVNVVGFTGEEIVFESSNPNYANITNEGGVYILTITGSQIAYPNDKPYTEVTISSYGVKKENNVTSKSRVQTTSLRIYEFILDKNNMFADNILAIRVLTATNIKGLIADKLQIETSTSEKSVETFKKSFKNNEDHVRVWLTTKAGQIISLPTKTTITTDEYMITGYEITPLIITTKASYTISVSYEYTYKKGTPDLNPGNRDFIISGTNTFDIEVYINSNSELPIPIYTYEDMLEMRAGEYYRQVNDIVIRGTDFQMITNQVAGFDGNGYKIKIIGDYWGAGLTDLSNFALFETISQDSIFENITVVIDGRKNIQIDNTYSTSGVNIGVIAAVNNGIITNCRIESNDILYVNLIATVTTMESSYFGAVCAVNNGYITNSQVEANVSVSGTSLGGFVAINTGKISSCYVKKSRIANTSSRSNENITTGGFVCNNEGQITMSYVEGDQNENKIFADYVANQYGLQSKIIYTSSAVGGFVHNNVGTILDCYANIPIVSSSRCAGFVFNNSGSIKRAISLSKMKMRDTMNYAFIMSYDKEKATFEDCFFIIQENIINDYTSESNYSREVVGSATVQFKGLIDGVNPLKISDFNILEKSGDTYKVKENHSFTDFVISNKANDTSGVWFFVKDDASETASPLITYGVNATEFNRYNVDTKNYTTTSFVARRLHLVSPNLIATSRQNLNVKNDEAIAAGDYTYSIGDGNIKIGSKNNPYTIATAKEFEDLLKQRNYGVLEYYRLISDIDYVADGVYNSTLQRNTLIAHFEGNNLNVSNYSVNNKESYISSGLIAQLGTSSAMQSIFKNATFIPNYVNLPNTVYVGGFAGSVINSQVYNITVAGEDVIVSGKNIVGGVFGRTYGENTIKHLTSNIVAKSTRFDSGIKTNKYDAEALYSTVKFNETGANRSNVSYSGAIIGYVGGDTLVDRLNIGDSARSYGAVAGLLFGGVGALATVSNADLQLNSFNNEIKAYAFGGIISGENCGNITNITINSKILHKKLFNCYPIFPIAIGGVAGICSDGDISNIYSTDGYSVIGMDFTSLYSTIEGTDIKTNVVNNPYVVKYVGGVVGYAKVKSKSTYNNIVICDKEIQNSGLIISGGAYVGGVIGHAECSFLSSELIISSIKIGITSVKTYFNQEGEEVKEGVYTQYYSEASVSSIPDLVIDINSYAFALFVNNSEGSLSLDDVNFRFQESVYIYIASNNEKPKPNIAIGETEKTVENKIKSELQSKILIQTGVIFNSSGVIAIHKYLKDGQKVEYKSA